MATPTSAWASAGRVVRAVAGHRDELAARLLPLDERHLVLGSGLGEEVVDAGLLGDRLGRQRVVTRDHDGLDAHAAQLVEPLPHALLDDVLEVDDAQHPGARRRPRRRRAAACRPPRRSGRRACRRPSDDLAALLLDPGDDRTGRALADLAPVDVHTRHPGLGGEGDPLGAGQLALVALAQPVLLLRQDDDGAALGRLVGQRGELGGVRDLGLGGAASPARTRTAWRLPRVMVPVLSSSRVDTSPAASTARPDMARTLRWTSRSMPAMPIAESSAPIVVGIRQTSRATSTTIVQVRARVVRERRQGGDREQEDDGERREQDVQRDLVGRLLPGRALDQGDHPVDEGLTGLRRDLDDDRGRRGPSYRR